MQNDMYWIGKERAKIAAERWHVTHEWRDAQDVYGHLQSALPGDTQEQTDSVKADMAYWHVVITDAKIAAFEHRQAVVYNRLAELGQVIGCMPNSIESENLLKEAHRLSNALDSLQS